MTRTSKGFKLLAGDIPVRRCRLGANTTARDPRVTRRLNEIETRVDTHVVNVISKRLLLGVEVRLVLVLEVVDDWRPAIRVVDIVAKAGAVDEGEPAREALLLDVCGTRWLADARPRRRGYLPARSTSMSTVCSKGFWKRWALTA